MTYISDPTRKRAFKFLPEQQKLITSLDSLACCESENRRPEMDVNKLRKLFI